MISYMMVKSNMISYKIYDKIMHDIIYNIIHDIIEKS